MRFNIKQMLVMVALVAFLIAFLRPLLSEPIGSISAALGEDHGRKVFSHQFAVATRPVTFMLGSEKPPELEFEFSEHRDGRRGWGSSDSGYEYHNLQLSPNKTVRVKDSDPEYFGVLVLSSCGLISGCLITLVYWAAILYGFVQAFLWANRTSPAKA